MEIKLTKWEWEGASVRMCRPGVTVEDLLKVTAASTVKYPQVSYVISNIGILKQAFLVFLSPEHPRKPTLT